MHPFKVIVRTQSAPTLDSEYGVQCLRSQEELIELRKKSKQRIGAAPLILI